MDKNLALLSNEIEEGLTWLRLNLPTRIAGMEISAKSKIPFKVLMCRAAFAWRFAELCAAANESLKRGQLVSGVLLTRAAVEISAAVWYLSEQVKRSVTEGSLGNVDDRLMKLLMGNKVEPDMPSPVHVNDFIKVVAKQVPGFEEHYNRLSEFAHPNWAGTLFSYSRPDPEERSARFGPYLRTAESTKVQAVVGLSGSLLMFRKVFDELGALMPAFTAVCETGK